METIFVIVLTFVDLQSCHAYADKHEINDAEMVCEALVRETDQQSTDLTTSPRPKARGEQND